MNQSVLRQALWHRHVNALNPSATMRAWLGAPGSLTARLVAHSRAFRVQRLRQHSAVCLRDEACALGLARPVRVWEREVLLRCDGRAVVFAHTVVPLSDSAADWPLFGALGERSLGSTLFHDPLVRRGALEFARIRAGHPLARRARAALAQSADLADLADLRERPVFHARRCVYRRGHGTLLVTELFLPAVLELVPAQPITNPN